MRELITIPLVVMVIAAVVFLWPQRQDEGPPPKIVRLAELTFFAAVLVVLLGVTGKPLF